MPKLVEMEKAWRKSLHSIFRLEALPIYRVPEDLIIFEKWKKGEPVIDGGFQEWFKFLEETKKRGVTMQRVRIVPLPLSDYMKYEIDVWKHSTKHGEQFLFLESDSYKELVKQFNFKPKDFWMFDDKILIIFHYDQRGDFLREEPIQDKQIIKQYADLKKKLLEKAIPMKQFLEKRSTAKN